MKTKLMSFFGNKEKGTTNVVVNNNSNGHKADQELRDSKGAFHRPKKWA